MKSWTELSPAYQKKLLAKGITPESRAIEKAGLSGTPMSGFSTAAVAQANLAQVAMGAQPQAMVNLPALPQTFDANLGPARPFLATALDALGINGRPAPRKYQYNVAENLDINKKLAAWSTLRSMAEQCDIVSRCITIVTTDASKKDLKYGVSKSAISRVMEERNVGQAQAAKIAREQNLEEIVALEQFMTNPYPQSDRGYREWISEFMFQSLVYDGVPVHPVFNLSGKCIGLDIIDASTIKILLDNYGDIPRPPNPAYQQILWGFPRGEFVASPNSDAPTFLGGEFDIDERDQLSYFVMNRRTTTPYGWSPVEQALEAANIYLERQRWLAYEYKHGTTARAYMKTNDNTIGHVEMSAWERIYNDANEGDSANRMKTRLLPSGWDVEFAPHMDSLYKGDYDEELRKWVASFFGVAPAQIGVVARAGLGGGKGAQEGEQDNAETVSARPRDDFIEECINSLGRRYLGQSMDVSCSIGDDRGAEDDLEVANAGKIYTGFGGKTLNEWREDQGLPPLSFPEADQPFLATPTGPVFFTGTLESQLNPPPAIGGQFGNAPQAQAQGSQTQGQDSSGQKPDAKEGTDSGGAKETVNLKADEAKAYRRFVSKGHKREFIFEHHDPDEVEILKAGLVPETPKRKEFAY